MLTPLQIGIVTNLNQVLKKEKEIKKLQNKKKKKKK